MPKPTQRPSPIQPPSSGPTPASPNPGPLRAASVALLGLILATPDLEAQHPSTVVDYRPGTGFSPGYTNAAAALGAPSRVTPGDFGGPVTPFAPPYTREQLVSIGTGGSLTLRWDTPIRNAAGNPFGLDFTVFGSTGFLMTNEFDANWNPIGAPATDGSLFNPNPGTQRLSVSADGSTWYVLDPARAPKVDHYHPTDGSGDFGIPMSLSLQPADFAGKTLDQIRGLYRGSAGGAAFDLDWALDATGKAVALSEASFVRIDVLTGKADIDALSLVATVPEPGTWGLMASALATGWLGRRIARRHP